MLRTALLLLTLALCSRSSLAQSSTDSSHLRVSLLTIGVSDEIYASFGHTALRVYDSLQGTDLVYNYGTFNGFEENFEIKFMLGKLLYYCSVDNFRDFYYAYVREERRVQEQVLLLDGAKKQELYAALRNNALEQNRYYKYDFLFDNCATRIRDIFPMTFGSDFRFGQTLPAGSRMTFRQMINRYLAPLPWERFGINLLLGSRIDSVMSNEGVMFLPDYLRDGIGNGRVGNQKVATEPVTLLDGPEMLPAGPNYPLWVMLCIGLLTGAGLLVPRLAWLGNFMSVFLLVVTGLLGCLIVFMWLGTDHEACQRNWNVLWALPTNLVVPFFRKRGRNRYAVIAIACLLASLVLHVLSIQELPLLEISPVLVALLLVFGTIYRQSPKQKTV